MFPFNTVEVAGRVAHLLAFSALNAFCACAPKLEVGAWTCPASADAGVDAASLDPTAPITVPWSTGFETRFCDYNALTGFCYADANASAETVTSPKHAGQFAAAFHVNSDDSNAHQVRCVRQGVLPVEAYYGAWYFVPALVDTNAQLWNLFHFRGDDPSTEPGLWDVSLVNGASGDLELVVFDFLNKTVRRPQNPTPIPIGSWFHLQLYVKRAVDATGEIRLYQDGQLLFDAAGVVTAVDGTTFHQWYVGNLVDTGISPADSVVYVDDVTISATL
ncbi:MAG TPA: heparin lyase I family protein [Polyangiaceae bacterium]